jgi:hypothetical protein
MPAWIKIRRRSALGLTGALAALALGSAAFGLKKPPTAAANEPQIEEADPNVVSPAHEGQLVHLVGTMRTDFGAERAGLHSESVLRSRRRVEMYQWLEERSDTAADGYSYHLGWSERWTSSAAFHRPVDHINPLMPMYSKISDSPDIKIGNYRVDPCIIDKMTDFRPVPITRVPPHPRYPSPFYPARPEQAANGSYYIGWDPQNPHLGDVRIFNDVIQSQTYSLIARQSRSSLTCAPDNGSTIIKAGVLSARALLSER